MFGLRGFPFVYGDPLVSSPVHILLFSIFTFNSIINIFRVLVRNNKGKVSNYSENRHFPFRVSVITRKSS